MKRCDGLLSDEECEKVLFTMKNNKAPGPDGISVEFYKTFWHDIKHMLVDSLNEGFVKGQLSTTHKKEVLFRLSIRKVRLIIWAIGDQ